MAAPASTDRRQRSHRARSVGVLSGRQANLLLAVAVVVAIVTGVVSWAVGTEWARWWTALHAVAGILVVVLTPVKIRRSVRPGMRRRRWSRWVSAAFGVLVLVTVGLGVVHATGLWYGVGYWSALWTHTLLAFVVLPMLIWHMWSRPSRPRAVDLDRRLLIGGGAATLTAAAVVAASEGVVRVVGLDGGSRAATGSHEVGSFDPAAMPSVSWIDDTAPSDTSVEAWELSVGGRSVDVAALRQRAAPVVADLDCTGGWWSRQEWLVVPIADLLASDARSFQVTSSTGYQRTFPMRDATSVYLAVGYGDEELRRRHGAPVRVVAPGRRGPWWVKWVVSVEPTDRPWWFQLPFEVT
ncbi:MAG: molybdopterin-dependent oxidoreductase [Actinomycetota bacterium]